MKNKKGFTLIELLAVVVILVILISLAVPAVSRYLTKGSIKYYNSLEDNLVLAGREYLNDYPTLYPKEIENVTVIKLNELTDNKYIDDVVDGKGNKCDAEETTVTVKKVSKNKYEYYTCLKCGDYQTKVENCGFSEEDNVTTETKNYSIGGINDKYIVNQGESFTVPIAKAYYLGELVDSNVNGSPRIIDTNKLGTTTVTYSYKGQKKQIIVEVKEEVSPSIPQIVLKYDNKNGKVYDGRWYAGKIYAEFKSTDYTKPGLNGSGVSYYEISADQQEWQKISGNSYTFDTDGNITYYVRSVDKLGNISENNTFNVKIESVPPECTILANGQKATNNWYSTDVTLSLDIKKPASGNWHNSNFNLNYSVETKNISGNTYYYGTTTNPTTTGTSTLINTNTDGTAYYVKVCSGAGLCSDISSYQVKLDKEAPNINVAIDKKIATINLNDNFELSMYGINYSDTEEPIYTDIGEKNKTINYTATRGGTHYIWVKDEAGNIKKTSFEIDNSLFDTTPPNSAVITISGSKTQTTTPIILSAVVTHSDDQTGVNISKSKWIYNTTASEIGTDASNYTNAFSSETETINLSTEEVGTYYLHILTVDNGNNMTETIKGPIAITANYHKHSGSTTKAGSCYSEITHTSSWHAESFSWGTPNSSDGWGDGQHAICDSCGKQLGDLWRQYYYSPGVGGGGDYQDYRDPANPNTHGTGKYQLICTKTTSTIDNYKITY